MKHYRYDIVGKLFEVLEMGPSFSIETPQDKLEKRIAALEGKRPPVSPAIDIINGATQK